MVDKKLVSSGKIVAEIVRVPRDVGRYWQIAVCEVALPVVLTRVQPGMALPFARKVTLPLVFIFAAIGLVCR